MGTYSRGHQKAIVHGSGLPRQQLVAILEPLAPSVHAKVPLLAVGVQVRKLPQWREVGCKKSERADADQVL